MTKWRVGQLKETVMAPENENDRPFPIPEQDEGNPPEPEKGSPVPSDLELEELDKEIEAEDNPVNDENKNDLAAETNVEPGNR
jgi:hypothetical protein